MSTSRANLPLKLRLRPEIAIQIEPRALRLGLTSSGYAGVLVWNDSIHPAPDLIALQPPERLTRVAFPCSLRVPLRALASRQARARRLSMNAYLEALFGRDLRDPFAPLTILPAP